MILVVLITRLFKYYQVIDTLEEIVFFWNNFLGFIKYFLIKCYKQFFNFDHCIRSNFFFERNIIFKNQSFMWRCEIKQNYEIFRIRCFIFVHSKQMKRYCFVRFIPLKKFFLDKNLLYSTYTPVFIIKLISKYLELLLDISRKLFNTKKDKLKISILQSGLFSFTIFHGFGK